MHREETPVSDMSESEYGTSMRLLILRKCKFCGSSVTLNLEFVYRRAVMSPSNSGPPQLVFFTTMPLTASTKASRQGEKAVRDVHTAAIPFPHTCTNVR